MILFLRKENILEPPRWPVRGRNSGNFQLYFSGIKATVVRSHCTFNKLSGFILVFILSNYITLSNLCSFLILSGWLRDFVLSKSCLSGAPKVVIDGVLHTYG